MIFLSEYGLFLLKTATVVIAIIIIIATLLAARAKARAVPRESLQVTPLNEKYDDLTDAVHEIILTKPEKKAHKAQQKKDAKKNKKSDNKPKNKIFILRFNGDVKASATDDLRETITAILLTAKETDQVLVCLESGGGLVNAYGFAASQLQRIRDANIHLTIAIDKIAASGGYMMACVANQIIAAPFSIIGSIGVVAQIPNFHRLLKKHDVDFEQLTAGEYKRTLTMFGENTKEGRNKLQSEIEETHELFKTFIKAHRPHIDLETVATGEYWFATQCLQKNLVDKLQTSDDYLLSMKKEFDLYELDYKIKQPLSKRITSFIQHTKQSLFYDQPHA